MGRYEKNKTERNKNRKIITGFVIGAMLVAAASLGVVKAKTNIAAYNNKPNDAVISASSLKAEADVTTTVTTTIETTTETTTVTNLDIVMVGDMLIHDGVYNSGKNSDGTYNFDHLFKNVKSDIQAADIAIANQETILGGTQLGLCSYPRFNSPQEIGDALVNAGFNVILHATNHTMDMGAVGVENTLNFWRSKYKNIAVLGIHSSFEDYSEKNPYVYTKDGIKVAILNYTYGTNGMPLPSGKEYMVNLLDKEKVAKDIEYAKTVSDFVIVCPHWGTEYVLQSTQYQREWAQFFADEGVDLVMGTHPHVIEPVEYVQSTDGTKSTLVYYSLGNFVSNQDSINTMLGGMAKVSISNEGGNAHITSYSAVPVVTHMLFGHGLITTYKLSDYTNELAAQNMVKMYERGMTVEKLTQISKQVFGDTCKIDDEETTEATTQEVTTTEATTREITAQETTTENETQESTVDENT
jgi:poly-gamma-glutamate synthesis protein (capsule biosynthesis protein)